MGAALGVNASTRCPRYVRERRKFQLTVSINALKLTFPESPWLLLSNFTPSNHTSSNIASHANGYVSSGASGAFNPPSAPCPYSLTGAQLSESFDMPGGSEPRERRPAVEPEDVGVVRWRVTLNSGEGRRTGEPSGRTKRERKEP